MFADDEIRLRALEPEDLEWLYAIENDTELWRWGNANVPYSRYVLKDYIASSRNDIYADGQLRLVVSSLRTGMVMGCVDLVHFDARHLRAEIGIVLFPDYRGKGYGVRVLRMLEAYGREHLYLHQLYSVVSECNLPARGLFEKAGYTRMAELKEWLRMPDGRFVSAYMYGLSLQTALGTEKEEKNASL